MRNITKVIKEGIAGDLSQVLDTGVAKRERERLEKERVRREFEQRQLQQHVEGLRSGTVSSDFETTQSFTQSDISDLSPERRRDITQQVRDAVRNTQGTPPPQVEITGRAKRKEWPIRRGEKLEQEPSTQAGNMSPKTSASNPVRDHLEPDPNLEKSLSEKSWTMPEEVSSRGHDETPTIDQPSESGRYRGGRPPARPATQGLPGGAPRYRGAITPRLVSPAREGGLGGQDLVSKVTPLLAKRREPSPRPASTTVPLGSKSKSRVEEFELDPLLEDTMDDPHAASAHEAEYHAGREPETLSEEEKDAVILSLRQKIREQRIQGEATAAEAGDSLKRAGDVVAQLHDRIAAAESANEQLAQEAEDHHTMATRSADEAKEMEKLYKEEREKVEQMEAEPATGEGPAITARSLKNILSGATQTLASELGTALKVQRQEILALKPVTNVEVTVEKKDKSELDEDYRVTTKKLDGLKTLKFKKGQHEDNENALEEWMTDLSLVVAMAAPFLGIGVIDLCMAPADIAFKYLICLDERDHARANVVPIAPDLSKKQFAVEQELIHALLLKVPKAAKMFCKRRARIAHGNKYRLTDMFFILFKMFKISSGQMLDTILAELEKPKSVTNAHLLNWLTDFQENIYQLQENGMLSEDYNFRKMTLSIDKALEGVCEDFRADRRDEEKRLRQDHPKDPFFTPIAYFEDYLEWAKGTAGYYYPDHFGEGNEKDGQSGEVNDCNFCRETLKIKEAKKRNHKDSFCYQKILAGKVPGKTEADVPANMRKKKTAQVHATETNTTPITAPSDKKVDGWKQAVSNMTIQNTRLKEQLEAYQTDQQTSKGKGKGKGKGAKGATPTGGAPTGDLPMPKDAKDRPCKNEQEKRNSCSYGADKCMYSHVEQVLSKFSAAECPHGKECWFFKNSKRCCYGKHSKKERDVRLSIVMRSEPAGEPATPDVRGTTTTRPQVVQWMSTESTKVVDMTDQPKWGTLDTASNAAVAGQQEHVHKRLKGNVNVGTSGGPIIASEVVVKTPLGQIPGIEIRGEKSLFAGRDLESKHFGITCFGPTCPRPRAEDIPRDGHFYLWGHDPEGEKSAIAYKLKWDNQTPVIAETQPESIPAQEFLEEEMRILNELAAKVSPEGLEGVRKMKCTLSSTLEARFTISDGADDADVVQETNEKVDEDVEVIEQSMKAIEQSFAERFAHHTHMNRQDGGEARPCFHCGGVDHWCDSCPIGKTHMSTELEYGIVQFHMLPDRTRRIIMKALRKRELQAPKYVWSSTSIKTECPLFSGKTCWDLDIDREFNVMTVFCMTDDIEPPGKAVRVMRLFPEQPWEDDEAERLGDQEFTSSDTSHAVTFDVRKTLVVPRGEFSIEDTLKRSAKLRSLTKKLEEDRGRPVITTKSDQKAEEDEKELQAPGPEPPEPAGEQATQPHELEEVEAFCRYVDDGMMDAKNKETHEKNWNEFPFERDGHTFSPYKHLGVVTTIVWVTCFIAIICKSQSSFVYSLLQEFWEMMTKRAPEYKRRKRKTPGPVSPIYTTEKFLADIERTVEKLPLGFLWDVCKHYIMALAYAERGTRPDLSVVINYLQRMVDRWDTDCDKRLIWVFEWLIENWDLVLVGIIDTREFWSFRFLGLPDSSHRDDKISRKSTNGFIIFLIGQITMMIGAYKTALMTWTSVATKESESAGVVRCMRELIEMKEAAQLLTGRKVIKVDCGCDNLPAVKNLINGGVSIDLRGARSMYGMSQAWMSDVFSRDDYNLSEWAGKGYCGDPFTKMLPAEELNAFLFDEFGMAHEKDVHLIPYQAEVEVRGTKKEDGTALANQRRRDRQLKVNKMKDMLTKLFVRNGVAQKDLPQLIHRSMNHVEFDEECDHCLAGKQRRKTHAAIGMGPGSKVGCVSADATGRIKPDGQAMERYVHVFHEESTGYMRGIGTRSLSSEWALDALKRFEEEIKQPTTSWRSAGDKCYLGEFKDYLVTVRKVTDFEYATREDPQDNFGPENRVGRWKQRVRTNLGYAEDAAWPLAGRYGDDVENLISGAWESVYGHDSYLQVLGNLAPFGTEVSVIKETPEKRIDKATLAPNTFTGFLAGFYPHGEVHVGYYLNGRLKSEKCKNFKIKKLSHYFNESDRPPRLLRFDAPDGRRRRVAASTDVYNSSVSPPPGLNIVTKGSPVDEQGWSGDTKFIKRSESSEPAGEPATEDPSASPWMRFICSRCGKIRGTTEMEVLAELDHIECADLGPQYSCELPQDQNVMDADGMLLITEDRSAVPENPMGRDCRVTKKVSRSQVWSEESFFGSGDTWSQKARQALDKELKKYGDYEAYAEGFEEWSIVSQRDPLAKRIRMCVIWYVKAYETLDKMLTARFVALGDKVWDALGQLGSCIEKGEVLFTSPPSLRDVRLFEFCAIMKGHMLSTDDWRGAYLQTELRNKHVHVNLPRDVQTEQELAMRMPVHLVLKSIYGIERAGHDFDHSATEALEALNWRSLRRFDSIPGFYVRRSDGTVLQEGMYKPYHVNEFESNRPMSFLDLIHQ